MGHSGLEKEGELHASPYCGGSVATCPFYYHSRARRHWLRGDERHTNQNYLVGHRICRAHARAHLFRGYRQPVLPERPSGAVFGSPHIFFHLLQYHAGKRNPSYSGETVARDPRSVALDVYILIEGHYFYIDIQEKTTRESGLFLYTSNMNPPNIDQAYDEAVAQVLSSVQEELREITAEAEAITAGAQEVEEKNALAALRDRLFGTSHE